MRLQVLGLMLASSLLMAADAPNDGFKKEYDKFEGTWKMESFTMDGKPSPIEDFAHFRMTLKGKDFARVAADGKSAGTYKSTRTTHPRRSTSHSPAGIMTACPC